MKTNSKTHLINVIVAIVLSAAFWLALAPFASAQEQSQCDGNVTPPTRTPLNDLGQVNYMPTDHPAQGGLYPNGYNQRPAPYNATGLTIANGVCPIRQDGTPDCAGTDSESKIVMISIGMCNSSMEFGGTLAGTRPEDGFQCRVMGKVHPDPNVVPSCSATPTPCLAPAANWKNPKLWVWDCAQRDMDAKDWACPNSTACPSETHFNQNPWDVLGCRLAAAGLSKTQVQVVWIKEALAQPDQYGAWPQHVEKLQGYLDKIMDHLVDPAYGFGTGDPFVPSVKMVFLSPRTHAWATVDSQPHSPEPYAYETGFADQKLIKERIQNSARRGWPWVSWGPYIWADGDNQRSDGLTWPYTLLKVDCTHPRNEGVRIVSNQLLAFFETDPVATPWFLRKPAQGETPPTITAHKDEDPVYTTTTVHFHATGTPGGAPIKEYIWTFDDGGYRYDPDNDPMKTNVSKTFPARSETGNPYRVHVTVVDTVGNSATAEIAFPVIQGASQPASVENKKQKVAALSRPKERTARKAEK